MALRILIYGINYWPEPTGIGKYSGEMAEWLAERGHEVSVVSAPPYYPAWQVDPPYKGWRYQSETVNGVGVIRCPLWVPKAVTGKSRVLHLLSFAISSFPVMLARITWKPDVVLVIEPPLFASPTALLTAKLSGAVSHLHIQDFELDAAFALNLVSGAGPVARVARRVERWLMRRFDRVSTISGRMMERLLDKGVPADQAFLLPNWVDLSAIRPMKDVSTFRRELAIPDDQTVLLYSGSMGEKQGLELIVEAAECLKEKPVCFVLCGDGPARLRIEAMAEQLDNIRFIPLQPMRRLNELLNFADIHLLPQRADATDLVMPSKLTGMLASGRPVVATAWPNTEIEQVLRLCGVVVAPGDAQVFADAVLNLVQDVAQRQRLGHLAREVAERNFSEDSVLATLEERLQAFSHGSP